MDDEPTHAELMRWLTRVEKKIDDSMCRYDKRLTAVERWVWVGIGLGTASGLTAVTSLTGITP